MHGGFGLDVGVGGVLMMRFSNHLEGRAYTEWLCFIQASFQDFRRANASRMAQDPGSIVGAFGFMRVFIGRCLRLHVEGGKLFGLGCAFSSGVSVS